MPLFLQDKTNVLGEKCYSALRGNKQPCDHCPLKQQQDSGKPLDFQRADGRSFEITTRPIQWNGLNACTLFVNDVTDRLDSTAKPNGWSNFTRHWSCNRPAASP